MKLLVLNGRFLVSTSKDLYFDKNYFRKLFVSTGLQCYSCNEARSEYECNLKGKLIRCTRPTVSDFCEIHKKIDSIFSS